MTSRHNNDFEKVKTELDLRTVIVQLTGLALNNNTGHLAECPFCKGHECFSIPKGKQGYRCFQCDKTGDIFTFLEEFEGLDKKAALDRAAKLANVTLEEKKSSAPKLTTFDKIRIEAAEYYHANMLSNGGKAWFTDTRGHLMTTLEAEKVGWSDGRLLDHLRSKSFSDKDIVESGVCREKEVDGGTRLMDTFRKGLAIFPHWSHKKVLHFTQKDPRDVPKEEKFKGQLPNEYRDKKWTFYGQDVMERYDEIILVEGENDRLQVLNSGIAYCMAMIGQISDDQLKALMTKCKGKKLYLWTDNDAGGRKYVRKISRAMLGQPVKVIVYGKEGDDPDSFLKAQDGDRKRVVRQLQMEAFDYPFWEIEQAAVLPTLKEKLEYLQAPGGETSCNIFRQIGQQPLIQQQLYTEKLVSLGFSSKAIDQQLDFSQDLLKQVSEYRATMMKEQDPISMGEIIFKFFSHHGRFYYDRENTVYLIYQNKTYIVGNDTAFNSLMLKMTRMIYSQAPGSQVWDSLKHIAYLNGRRIDVGRWIHTDVVKDTICYNLNSPNNVILKVSRERIEEIQNGMNDDNVLLSSSHKIEPFNFRPDVDMQEGFIALKELIFDNLTVSTEHRYLILCWMLSGFCPDMAPYQFIMKFEGYASSGKSTAAKFITTLIYGTDELSNASGAAGFSSASQNPILVLDNLENKDLNRTKQELLLNAATRTKKEKRKQGSDKDNVEESPRSLICVTAIEPFTLAELISRTVALTFDRRLHGSDNFHESEELEQLKKKRDMILSAILRFLQKEILPSLDQRKEFMTILNKQFKGHAKDRTNAYLALLMLILEKMLKYIPYYLPSDLLYGIESGDKEIYTTWIEEQNSTTRESETGSNTILNLLNGLIREYLQFFRGKTPVLEGNMTVLEHPEYGIRICKYDAEEFADASGEKFHRTIFEMVATSAEIVDAFDRLAKNTGKRNPYESASIFIARLRNDLNLLTKNGWALESKPEIEPYFKRTSTGRFLKLRHTLIR